MNVTTNGLIAAALLGILVGGALLAYSFFEQARWRWSWPVSALMAIGGGYLAFTAVVVQIVLFRVTTLPWPFGPNDPGTLVIRMGSLIVTWALVFRVRRGRLLTDGDRERVRRGPDA